MIHNQLADLLLHSLHGDILHSNISWWTRSWAILVKVSKKLFVSLDHEAIEAVSGFSGLGLGMQPHYHTSFMFDISDFIVLDVKTPCVQRFFEETLEKGDALDCDAMDRL